jgi:hypothetical protein
MHVVLLGLNYATVSLKESAIEGEVVWWGASQVLAPLVSLIGTGSDTGI